MTSLLNRRISRNDKSSTASITITSPNRHRAPSLTKSSSLTKASSTKPTSSIKAFFKNRRKITNTNNHGHNHGHSHGHNHGHNHGHSYKRKRNHTCTLITISACIAFYFVITCISFYNVSKINDPCFVASTSQKDLVELSTLKRRRLGTKQQQQKQQNQQQQQQQLRNGQTNIKESKRKYIRNEDRRIVEIGLGLGNEMDKNSNNDNEEESSSSIGFKPDIPKIIHQQWKDERIPPKFMKWRQKWLSLYPEPDYKHMLWTDKTGRQLIENHYPWFLTTYDNYEHNINRADAVRYFILYHYGGIYADLDYEPMINFYNYLPSNAVGLIESPYYWNEKTQNSLMTSPKGDLFWTDLFTVLIRNSQFEDVLVMTGPSLVDDAISITNQPTYILPCENFHRVPLGEYKDASITTIVGREVQFRLKPVSKQCGVYNDDRCHFGKHHNTVSYRTVLGNLV